MADNSDEELPEDFVCPICFELLVGQVFQCVNGHVICEKCVKSVLSCPQCRIEYNGAPIRVRVLENMLDRMSFNCKYKKKGCTQMLKRADLFTHNETCEHGGIVVGLCEILGLLCDGKANTRNMQDALGHLICDHQMNMEGNLDRIFFYIEDPFGQKQTRNRKQQWHPILIETADPNSRLIISVATTMESRFVSLEIQTIRVRLNHNVCVKPIQLEVKISVENEVIKRIQQVEDVEHCESWRYIQLMRFGPQNALYLARNGIRIECVIYVDGKSETSSTPNTMIKLLPVITPLPPPPRPFGALKTENVQQHNDTLHHNGLVHCIQEFDPFKNNRLPRSQPIRK